MQSLDHWAAVAAMSRRTFTARLKEETGLSFSVWRQKLKLSAAIKMLNAGKPISEIARALGYKNQHIQRCCFASSSAFRPGNTAGWNKS